MFAVDKIVTDSENRNVAKVLLWFTNSLLEDIDNLATLATYASDYEYIKNHADPEKPIEEEEENALLDQARKMYGNTFRYASGKRAEDLQLYRCLKFFSIFLDGLYLKTVDEGDE